MQSGSQELLQREAGFAQREHQLPLAHMRFRPQGGDGDAGDFTTGVGYMAINSTRRHTIGVGLNHSPALCSRGTCRAAADRDAALTAVLADRLSIPAEALAAWRELPAWTNARDNVDTWPREARTIARHPFTPSRLQTLDAAVLVLVGEQSPTWRHHACHAITDALPAAETVVLDDQGHLAMLADPDHFAGTIRRFFT